MSIKIKKCNKCGVEKPHNQFHKRGNGVQSKCKSCAVETSKEWYNNKKNHDKVFLYQRAENKKKYLQNMVNNIKEHYGCVICQEKESCCLDFHHINEKDKNVSYFVHIKNLSKIINEISKCICVCANCHRKIHANKIKVKNKKIEENEVKKIIENFKKYNPWIPKKL